MVLCSVTLLSCVEPAYIPNKMHVPFFSKKGQVQVEVVASETVEFAGGYAFTDRFAALATLRLMNRRSSDSNFHQNRAFDISGGYFYSNAGRPERFEVYARIGSGYTNVVDQETCFSFFGGPSDCSTGFFSYDYTRYALQVNAGWEWKYFTLGSSIRGGYMQLQNVQRIVRSTTDGSTLSSEFGPNGSAFIDFAIIVRLMPSEQIGIELQTGVGGMNETIGFKESETNGIMSIGLFCKF
jgi:hypothetical protein